MNELLRQKHEGEKPGGLRRDGSDSSRLHGDGRVQRSIRCLVLDGDKWKIRNTDYETRFGGCGFGISYKDVMYTLNTVDRHIVAVFGD